ncbi:MAG: hypothetical protein IT462_02890 [Planctomycetes bacterium]|nr:hypothetical protein [Planctomycetota bacterium]
MARKKKMTTSVLSKRVREIKPNELDFSKEEVQQFDMNPADRRRYQRASLDVPIKLRLISASGATVCSGKAVLRDLSLDGAFITSIEITESEVVDTDAKIDYHHICFEILDGPFKGVEAKAKPVRIGPLASGIGVTLEKGFSLSL